MPALVCNARLGDRGFTLLELLIVIAILGLLGVLGTLQMMSYLGRARTDTAKLQINQIVTALNLFRVDVGRLPSNEEGTTSLVTAPQGLKNWRGPYLTKAEALMDPWGRPFIYHAPGQKAEYDLLSYGADGQPGGSDENADVSN